jgi:type IV pilus assembly protein PilY1
MELMNTLNIATSSSIRKPVTLTGLALGVLLSLSASPLYAGLTFPAVPLQTGTAVPPNIMFVLDDSGSMQGEVMPDELYDMARFLNTTGTALTGDNSIGLLFPRTLPIYGNNGSIGDERLGYVIEVNSTQPYARMTRSPQINSLYYNPGITYQPWTNPDGTLMANANPTCAWHNPMTTVAPTGIANAELCRNLTVNNTSVNVYNNATSTRTVSFTTRWVNYSTSCAAATPYCFATGNTGTAPTAGNRTFYPATYYWYNGTGNRLDNASYQTTQIISTTATYSGQGRDGRTDCGGDGICSYTEEMQNFANWYTYYRSRTLLARGGIGKAFGNLPLTASVNKPAARIGFGTINQGSATIDGVSSAGIVVTGVRPFVGTDRTNFYSTLYNRRNPMSGTPLRNAVDGIGKYYQRDDNRGPWSETPGTTSTVAHIACRQSYNILSTDGYWNSADASAPANANNDGTSSAAITGPSGASFTYTAGAPFSDNRSNTLADPAMYYWKTDLRPTLQNRVPTTSDNPAFWQHMVTIGVGLGVSGTITPSTAFNAINTGATINWPDPNVNGPAKLDDLLHAAVNSRGDYFTANNPVEFSQGLAGVLNTIEGRSGSASAASANSAFLRTGSQFFRATYKAGAWAGELTTFPITTSGISATPAWKASDGIPTAPTSRKIYTWNGTAGVVFDWANLTNPQKTALGNNVDRYDYLRGNRTQEANNGGAFRNREHLLGDIVHSAPFFEPETETIYFGTNQGMLHAFNANTGTTPAQVAARGKEVFAYVPGNQNWNDMAFTSNPSYGHSYQVDGPVVVSRRSQGGGKNILVGSLGRGGKGLFALDVTNPSTFTQSNVMWELGGGDPDMGLVISQPVIAKMNNGANVALVSNGPNSTNDGAALFVINLATGAVIRKIVPAGATGNNGLSAVRGFDSNGDGDVDILYAGDLRGNVWKFDVRSSDPNLWAVGNAGAPIFVALSPTNVRQPISSGLELAFDDNFNLWLFFGTGKYLEASDPADLSVQTWYGILDDNSTITRTDLKQRKIVLTTTLNSVPVRAFEQAVAGDMANKKGWYIDFLEPPNPPGTATGERMVFAPSLFSNSTLIGTSIRPTTDICDVGGTSFLNAVNPFTGTNVTTGVFDLDGNGSFGNEVITDANGVKYLVSSVGLDVGIANSTSFISDISATSGSNGAGAPGAGVTTGGVSCPTGLRCIRLNDSELFRRISWRELIGD